MRIKEIVLKLILFFYINWIFRYNKWKPDIKKWFPETLNVFILFLFSILIYLFYTISFWIFQMFFFIIDLIIIIIWGYFIGSSVHGYLSKNKSSFLIGQIASVFINLLELYLYSFSFKDFINNSNNNLVIILIFGSLLFFKFLESLSIGFNRSIEYQFKYVLDLIHKQNDRNTRTKN